MFLWGATDSRILGNMQNCLMKHKKRMNSVKRKEGTACWYDLNFKDEKQHHVTNEQSYEHMRWAQRRGYLVVGVALWIEGRERRGRDFVQPLSLWVRPCLVIKGNLRRFYLRCTDRAQHGATHTHTKTVAHTLICKLHCSLIICLVVIQYNSIFQVFDSGWAGGHW